MPELARNTMRGKNKARAFVSNCIEGYFSNPFALPCPELDEGSLSKGKD
jgi:hypothetical protein